MLPFASGWRVMVLPFSASKDGGALFTLIATIMQTGRVPHLDDPRDPRGLRPDAPLLDAWLRATGPAGLGVATLPDLSVSHPLPKAPWFPPDGRRSARRVFVHIVGETAQHAGHADIIREALDGSKSMG